MYYDTPSIGGVANVYMCFHSKKRTLPQMKGCSRTDNIRYTRVHLIHDSECIMA